MCRGALDGSVCGRIECSPVRAGAEAAAHLVAEPVLATATPAAAAAAAATVYSRAGSHKVEHRKR